MNFSFLNRYWSFYLIGAKNTVLLALIAVVIGAALGLLLAICRISKSRILRFVSTAYVEFVRGTPLLVQLFIIYYGLQAVGIRFPDIPVMTAILDINFSDFMSGVITMGLNSAAYVCEIFRSGIQSVDKGQMEAGRSLGLSYGQTLQKIIVPQAIRNVLPALGNEFVVVIKESSIVSIIGIADLMYKANTVRGNTFQPFEPLLVAALVYFLLTFTLSKLLAYIEKRMRNHD
ncbi:MAG: amino acid ABC transporter permease [Candidatus Treponema excrementipullorum]|uniref:Putative glutamine transport system permease protein GlnP n=1 Tax=Candidatus Treponema excrementipullorum TaxID=2838768 RepID=A0A9E2P0X0_9SPIR|nr:amino acid ABC transporter permease [Candidatus Treponema excrementipullorum]MCI6479712.1 amino acid ABC transporter permease [Spirochaetia bacterium]MCI6952379.1 amino acid ABC transporter permease [Spirochaetia bacterium]MDD7013280.1 amino acid ABC transporter permease [Candidatus Treponema excrementipullorum]MDY2755631.1 amino acid ABC transporter permease [Candidatus Treponema excrementipullorum]